MDSVNEIGHAFEPVESSGFSFEAGGWTYRRVDSYSTSGAALIPIFGRVFFTIIFFSFKDLMNLRTRG